jgi:hypothetical protein
VLRPGNLRLTMSGPRQYTGGEFSEIAAEKPAAGAPAVNDGLAATPPPAVKKWRPLERTERRVAGVLAEKAKTTPENYPLSINSLINGCNQKSNRFPQMQLDEDQVSAALDVLRHAGAVSLIQGDGRVEKFRHLLYDWLGVDKAELAVMTELLLRGAQTLGELRGRAARMEPIADIGSLMPIVDGLRQKNLLIYLTPSGRGAVVTHNLYQPQELAKLRAEHGGDAINPSSSTSPPGSVGEAAVMSRDPHAPPPGSRADTPTAAAPASAPEGAWQSLRDEILALRRELTDVREQAELTTHELRRELDDLKTQLGG